MSDWDDLNAFVTDADEDAFARIVRRHVGLVHGTALRTLNDRMAAEEVTQTVFVLLTEKASRLKPSGSLGAWLYRCACLQAKDYRRRETRRHQREKAAAMLESAEKDTLETHWAEMRPFLEDAMGSLSAKDREALILRFFEKRPLREVGEALGLSEDATRKRVARALERLRSWFERHQMACSASVLGGVIGTFAVSGVSKSLVEATIRRALANTPSATAGLLSLTWPLAGAFVASVALPFVLAKASSSQLIVSTPVGEPLADAVRTGLFAVWDDLKTRHGDSMPALYAVIGSLEDPYRRQALQAVFMTDWASVDPEAMLRFFQGVEIGVGYYLPFHHAWKTCLRVNPERGIDAVVAHGAAFQDQMHTVLNDIAMRRPSALPTLAKFVPQKSPTDTRLLDAYMEASENHLVETRQSLDLLEGDARREASAGVAKAWAKKDGQAAWEWAQSLEPSEVRGRALRALLEGWAMTDPVAALEHVDEAPEGGGYEGWGNRGTAFMVMSVAAANHLELALDWYAKNPSFPGASALGSGLAMRLDEQPAELMELVRQHPERMRLAKHFEVYLLNMEPKTVAALREWLRDQPKDEFTSSIRNPLVSRMVSSAPDEAVAFANALVAEEALDAEDLSKIAASFIGNDSANLERHLGQAAPELRQALLKRAVPRLSRMLIDVEAWDQHLLELPNDLHSDAVRGLGSARAAANPVAALEWAEGLPSESQTHAIEGIAKTWAEADSYACSVWLAGKQAGPLRDSAAAVLVDAIASADAESAWIWTETIQAPSARELAVKAILEAGTVEDARKSLQTSSLPVQAKRRWHDYLDKQGH